MAIEWTERYSVWTARIEWAEIRVCWDNGQWWAYSDAPPISQGVGAGSLEGAQREALRLLIDKLMLPIVAYEHAQGEALMALPPEAFGGQNEP